MFRRIVLSLVVVAGFAFVGASQADARGCYRGGHGHHGGYYGGHSSVRYSSGPSYYRGGHYGHRSQYYGHRSYYGHRHSPHYYGGSGVSFSIGF